jgi:hypothetical protein
MSEYVDTFPPELQVRAEEGIAALIFDFQRGQIELDDENACEDHTLTEEDCQVLSQYLLEFVLSQFRPDLIKAG